ncbi:MAG TPA: chemotaxis protein CheD [Thermomicrobiales bacterium]|nr:chemotaxis protein CheD [Thermomicrobiales bacterium]
MTASVQARVAQVPVGLGEVKYSSDPREALVAFGLGSCVGVAIWAPTKTLGALAHVILPTAGPNMRRDENRLKYAEFAVPAMIEELLRRGATPAELVVRIAGGAQMLRDVAASEVFNIGARNIQQVRHEIARAGLKIAGEHVLGYQGRTMSLFLRDGRVTIHSAGKTIEI